MSPTGPARATDFASLTSAVADEPPNRLLRCRPSSAFIDALVGVPGMVGKVSAVDRWLVNRGILEPSSPLRVNMPIAVGVVGFHLVALLAFIPWFFSWSGLAWAVAGLYLFGTLG